MKTKDRPPFGEPQDPLTLMLRFIGIKASFLARQKVDGKLYSEWMPYYGQELLEGVIQCLKHRFGDPVLAPRQAVARYRRGRRELLNALGRQNRQPKGYDSALQELVEIFDVLTPVGWCSPSDFKAEIHKFIRELEKRV